jgi:asparagine synthase (glutamine-hydrolysing)
MCGIAAVIGGQSSRRCLPEMAASLRSRGPDDDGFVEGDWFAIGFRRLSIFATSTGRQPVASPGGEIALAFNGELYNYRTIARDLERRGVRVRCEAEALLALYTSEGADFTRALDGDYAIVVCDARTRTCHLLRDPFGVKPLYYAPLGDAASWAVSSDPAAMFVHPEFSTDWDLTALAERHVLGFCSWDRTNFAAIRQVPPGGRVTIHAGAPGGVRVWPADPGHLGATRALDVERLYSECARLVGRAVRRRIDHRDGGPVVLALSGGIDSSLLAALAAERSREELHAVTIGAEGGGDDRAAAAVARSLGVRHRFDEITADALIASLPRVVLNLGSQGPSYSAYFVGAAARRLSPAAKVLLVGEGADELFFGYQIHRDPMPYARVALAALDTVPKETIETSELLRTVARWRSFDPPRVRPDLAALLRTHQLVNRHLVPFDHATMAHGLECRVPYLDLRLARWLTSIPESALAGARGAKPLLRLLAADRLAATGCDRLVLGRSPSPLRAALAPARAALTDRIRRRLSSSSLSRRPFAPLAKGPEELFWLAAVEAVFLRRRARIDGMEIGDLEAEVMAAAA